MSYWVYLSSSAYEYLVFLQPCAEEMFLSLESVLAAFVESQLAANDLGLFLGPPFCSGVQCVGLNDSA